MRIVCPYTDLHPKTKESLLRFAPDAEVVDVGNQRDGYYRVLCDLWKAGETFLLIEHDIEIREDVVPSFEECGGQWCLFPYPKKGYLLHGSLGCTRFSERLLKAHPGFMNELPVQHWQHLDCEILPRLINLSIVRCIHGPPLVHHHTWDDGTCDCGATH